MKNALFLVGTLAVAAIWTSIASAGPAPGPKRPGPSAVEAARLKKNPPPNYLAHYLPDDRYKIAGGVWKYVSTDLDTYYHVPSSPNMLRQPASRVIGFATARDAEEAGYVPDPSDGTASKAAPTVPGVDAGGRSIEEALYLRNVSSIIKGAVVKELTALNKLNAVVAQSRNQQGAGGAAMFLTSVRPSIAEYLSSQREALAQVNRLKPPKKLRTYHALIVASYKSGINAGVTFDRAAQAGDLAGIAASAQFLDKKKEYLLRANALLPKLR